MKIKTREHVEELIFAALDMSNTDSELNYHICQNIDNYSPKQLATLVDYFVPHLISWSDKNIKKKALKVLNKIRYIEDDQITEKGIPCVPLNLPIFHSKGNVVEISYFGDPTLAVIVGAPNKETKYFDFSDGCYLAWIIPANKRKIDICYGYEFSVERLLEGRFHAHPHILDCKPVYVDDLSRYGDSEWINNCINICRQAIKKLEEKENVL